MAPIYYQPALSNSMQLCTQDMAASDEKRPHQCSQEHQLSGAPCDCAAVGSHSSCHKSRLRRFLLPVAISLLLVGGLLVLSCVLEMDFMDLLLGGDGVVLGKRQTSSSGQQSSFTSKKLYLIIVFVGLFLVLIAAVMLSAWCCRGAFNNPLCCPCYLCACCGGLACLECIGCGLCAAGIDEAI